MNQDFNDFELNISDNCSTDNTPRICQEYVDRDPRINLTINSSNVGQLRNFDIALSKARGKYFFWAAGDDFWEPQFISALFEELEAHPEAGLAMCAIRRVHSDGSLLDIHRFTDDRVDPHKLSRLRLLIHMAYGLKNRIKFQFFIYGMFRTDIVKAAGKYGTLPVPHPDRIYMCQFALGANIRYVDKVLYIRTVHDEPAEQRWPDESYNDLINHDKWAYTKTVLACGPYLFRSPIIPWYRKFLIPIGWLTMARAYRRIMYRGRMPLVLRLPSALARRLRRLIA